MGSIRPLTKLACAALAGCDAYVFKFGNIERERHGSFFADFLNFRRITRTFGWHFEGVTRRRLHARGPAALHKRAHLPPVGKVRRSGRLDADARRALRAARIEARPVSPL